MLFGHRALTGLCLAGASWSCTLITDVDREKIPVPAQPTFPEVDAGPQPPLDGPDASDDASVTDAATPSDAGDAGPDPNDAAADAEAPIADAG